MCIRDRAGILRLSMRELATGVLVLDQQHKTVTARRRRFTAGDNPDRLRAEKSFAALTDSSPIPVNCGKVQGRFRLNRGGDRRANAALWRIAIVRLASEGAGFVGHRIGYGPTRTAPD